MTNEKCWEDEKRAITLTNHEWSRLSVFLLMTTHYREEERDGWRRLAEERDENGCKVWRNAEKNADFWQEQIDLIRNVQAAIDAI